MPPRARLASSPANFSALFHQSRASEQLMQRERVLRRGHHRRVPDPGVVLPRLDQKGQCLARDRRPVLVPGLLVLATPPNRPGTKVNV